MPDFLSEYWRVFLGVAVTVLVMWRLSQKATTLNLFKRSESAHEWNNAPLLREVLPAFANELHDLLNQLGEVELANQVAGLRLVDRCRCGDDFCGTFYAAAKPGGVYGPAHRNVTLAPAKGMIILDVVGNKIMGVEVLYRDEIRDAIAAALS